jgi:hypothetical protein
MVIVVWSSAVAAVQPFTPPLPDDDDDDDVDDVPVDEEEEEDDDDEVEPPDPDVLDALVWVEELALPPVEELLPLPPHAPIAPPLTRTDSTTQVEFFISSSFRLRRPFPPFGFRRPYRRWGPSPIVT